MSNEAKKLSARKAALTYIDTVIRGHADPGSTVDPLNRLSGADRAEAQRLALTILRHRANLDRLVQKFAAKPPPPSIRQILYLAVVEMQLFAAKDYAAVHSAVELSKTDPATKGKFAPMVNAVARRLSELPKDTLVQLKAPKLPKALRGPMIAAYTQPIVERIEQAHVQGAPLDIHLQPGTDVTGFGDAQSFAQDHLRLSGAPQVSALPGFDEGRFWVQDFAAQAAVRALGAIEGLTVLDLCAAPGGKTMQLAAGGAKVTALDISETRLQRVKSNLKRTKLSADLVHADALTWQPDQRFDLVLLDAPCSATGTIRRHPDLPFLKANDTVASLVSLQRALVERAVAWVKPGGRFVFVTCSLLPKEGERQSDWMEAAMPQLTPVPLVAFDPEMDFAASHRARLRPDMRAEQGGMDGFFFAQYRVDLP